MSKSTLRRKVADLAEVKPHLREHLVPLLREACGDDVEAGRLWNSDSSKWDAWHPYKEQPDSPPAGEDGSAQRKKYNEWYRKNVCPTHPTTCGAPWLAK